MRVPQYYLIGEESAGFTMQMMQFQEEHLWIYLNALGALDICLEQTIQYTHERTTFGQPVINNQYVHNYAQHFQCVHNRKKWEFKIGIIVADKGLTSIIPLPVFNQDKPPYLLYKYELKGKLIHDTN